MINLYTASTPNGHKASVTLEELAMPYTVHPINMMANEQKEEWFLKLNPNGRIPVIVDRAKDDFAVFESGAIMIYLAEKSGSKLLPTTTKKRSRVIQWLMFQMGGIGPMFGQAHHFLRFNLGKAPYAEERFKAEAARLYGVLDVQLRDHEYLAGEYSIADIATWPWISRFQWQQVDLADYPNIARWYIAIADRPAVQRGYDVPAKVGDIPRPIRRS